MKWRGEQTCVHFAAAPLRIDENKTIEEFDLLGGADTAVEILKIGAAAERDVLAIIYVLAIRQDVGGCAAAEEGALLEKTYAPAGFS